MPKKKLVVVESPSKAKTINKYLGRNYMVMASVGHVKDLAKSKLGVDVENSFAPKYITIKGKGDILKEIRDKSSKAGEVIIATDPDREGEAIAWHIAGEASKKNDNIKRVLFNEITKEGVKKGIANPMPLNENLYLSQQARRVMDRLIGFKVSPYLQKAMVEKTGRPLSAGRVQSVALRLIAEREKEILDFSPIEYWAIAADFRNEPGDILNARLAAFNGKKFSNPEGPASSKDAEKDKIIKEKLKAFNFIKDKTQAEKLAAEIKKQNYAISEIKKKEVKRNPQPPFTTSLLQQEGAKKLGFSSKKTMMIAQRLYEGVKLGEAGTEGLITYMRTDSVRLSPEAQKYAQDYITDKFGKEYAPAKPPVYKSKSSNVQDAHEAIRPTTIKYDPAYVKKHIGKDEASLYELIFNRFIASQMKPAILSQTTVDIEGGGFLFRASGSIIKFKGFLAAYKDMGEKNGGDKSILPDSIEEKQAVDLEKLEKSRKETKAPPRFNESSLVKELDEQGIGRPSTYSQIISTLLDRKYTALENKSFSPTELGFDVYEILARNFPDIFTVDFTVEMERRLDIIAEGNLKYADMLKDFYEPFTKSLRYAEEHGDIPEIPCPECKSPMELKISRNGLFLGCSRYPECRGTRPIPINKEKGRVEKKEPVIAEGVFCSCGKNMVIREGKNGRFYGCIDYPKCKEIKQITTEVKCPKCKEGELVEKYSRKTKKNFWGCSTYPKCDYITNQEPLNEKCPECGNNYLEIRFKKDSNGEWERYKNCPECRSKFNLEGALIQKGVKKATN